MSRVASGSARRIPRAISLMAAAATFLLGAVPAASQSTDPLSKLGPNSRFVLDLVMDSAFAAGLPTKSIMSKALEGISKKADDRRILDVVRKHLGNLRVARAALGPVNDEELIAAASVVEAGAKPQQLAPFKTRPQGRSELEAFTVWADFLARGVPKDEASSAITKLWQDGADDATFRSLWNNVQADILQGFNPGTALQNRIREGPARAPTSAGKPEGPQENQSSS